MSRFYATVCLPPTPPGEVLQAIATAMAPYDLNLGSENSNPDGHWDGWTICSTAHNAYLVLPRHDGDPRLVTAATVPRGMVELDVLGSLECCGGPRGLLEFDAEPFRSGVHELRRPDRARRLPVGTDVS
ncbi:hypothetical protein [Streptomyces sp. NPDC056160]|uniref:hypothetical protein n=1 Tax=Streptomyces sp. NPDC056160 TaxID=3345731 RepID=UPI0035D7C3F8